MWDWIYERAMQFKDVAHELDKLRDWSFFATTLNGKSVSNIADSADDGFKFWT